jgi:hypothetical protein
MQEMSSSAYHPQGKVQVKIRHYTTDVNPGLRKYAQKKLKSLAKERTELEKNLRECRKKFLDTARGVGDELLKLKAASKSEEEFLVAIGEMTYFTASELMELARTRRIPSDDEIQALSNRYGNGFNLICADGEQRKFVIEVLSDEQRGRGQLAGSGNAAADSPGQSSSGG